MGKGGRGACSTGTDATVSMADGMVVVLYNHDAVQLFLGMKFSWPFLMKVWVKCYML